jgi:hypothetical protein
VAHRVHADMEAVQPPCQHPMVNRPPPKADLHKLPVGHDPVLPRRQRRDLSVTWVICFTYVMNEMTHPPSVARQALQLSTRV